MVRFPFFLFVLAVAVIGEIRAEESVASRRLFADGEFSVGCNYWASNAGMYMWRRWSPETVEKDIRDLATNGIEIMRVFPLWPDFQPLTRLLGSNGSDRGVCQADGPLVNPAGVDEEMMRRFRFMCDVAQKHNVRVVVGLITGWMSGRLFVPAAFEKSNVLTDPEAVTWQIRFVRHFVRTMKDHPSIIGWDLGNECNCLASAPKYAAWTWMNAIVSAIRTEDAKRPVISGMHGPTNVASDSFSLRDQGELTDELTTHPYPLFTETCANDPFDSMRSETHSSAESLLYSGLSGRHCFVEEAGDLGRGTASPARSAANVRCALATAWANGLGAYFWWCAYDQDRLDFPPYDWNAIERELGLFTSDRREKPVFREMRAFREFLGALPEEVARIPPRQVDAVVLVSESEPAWKAAFGSYLLARQAGFDVSFASAERHPLPESKFYILPSGSSRSPYTHRAWKAVLEKVRNGATLLMTKGGRARYSGLLEATGNELSSYCERPRTFAFALKSKADIRINGADSVTTVMVPRKSEVLATDESGAAVMTVNALGTGKVVFCNFAVESDSASRSDCFDGENLNPRYLVYQEAACIAGVARRVDKSEPNVGMTEHHLADGRTIVVAVNYNNRPVDCAITIDGTMGRILRGEVSKSKICFGANDFVVFEVK